jgi:hypothetical protein
MTSGTHWDNEKGADMEGAAAASAFDTYLNASKVRLNIYIFSILSIFSLM